MSDDEAPGTATAAKLQEQMLGMQKLLETQMQLMQMQIASQNTPNTNVTLATSVKNVKVPEGRYDMNANEFRTFKKDCTDYKKLTGYTDNQIVLQIRMNADADLKRAIDINFKDEWDTYTVANAVEQIGTLMKEKNTPIVHRRDFDDMKQNDSERFKEFETRLKACAADCNFVCPFDETHDLTEYHMINRIQSGVSDPNLQQDLLQKSDTIDSLTLITAYCENYESAKSDSEKLHSRNPMSIAACEFPDQDQELSQEEVIAAISSYKRSKQQQFLNNNKKQESDTKKCFKCGGKYPHSEGSECPAVNRTCKKCQKKGHYESLCRSKERRRSNDISTIIISGIATVCSLSHEKTESLPKLKVQIVVDGRPPSTMEVVADTGAQVTVAGIYQMEKMGIKRDQLEHPQHKLKHAGGKGLKLLGSYPVHIQHNEHSIEDIIYFAQGVSNMYLSLTSCKKLYLIHEKFPHIKLNKKVNVGINLNETVHGRELPTIPSEIPFPATPENIQKLEKYLLNVFSKTTFNTVDPLPAMSGEPLKVHLKDGAIPYVVSTPLPIPHYWEKEIKAQLNNDERLTIIKKAPVGEANDNCARMLAVKKKNGQPRRAIDFTELNKHCKREVHSAPRPFDVVSNIPTKSYKTVLDAFNGYHQVPIHEDSIKYFTFITKYGRYQCLRAPQGFVGSGDAYNRRYDDIIVDVPRKAKVVDDTLLYDNNIADAFHHTFEYLLLCAKTGITLNPEKFKFARTEVNFCGYTIGWEGYRPSDDTVAAIQNFPMPIKPTITDIRSWFGLVNQLAPFLATTPMMTPFRELLQSSKLTGRKVYWDSELQNTFEATKSALCDIAVKGLAYFDTSKDTVLITDWSKVGIGLVLLQKHCQCRGEINPLCCTNGWKLILCNSRHTSPEERNYAPIEGEALAVVWAFKKAKMFLLGNPKFTIFVDHAPLLRIFGNRSLADIENVRLMNLKEKTLSYDFEIKYIKGLKNHANTLSRYPVNKPDEDDVKFAKTLNALIIEVASVTAEAVLSVTMKTLKEQCKLDTQYQELLNKIKIGTFAESSSLENPIIKEFYDVKDRLTVVDDLIMYSFEDKNLRTVIPKSLRHQMIVNLHAANQGSTGMLGRARHEIYWLGIDRDVKIHCETCKGCRESAPSHPKEPLIPTDAPEYPFQQVCADLFEINNKHYLAYVDRLTGFAELSYYSSCPNSLCIIKTFREFFHRWGVAEGISLDGGPNISSYEIKQWLSSWGTEIRLSSAYYPQSNGRAEAGVKSLKRLLRGNTGRNGGIDNDSVARALLQYRNTPLRIIEKSPAELALGRPLRDSIPLPKDRYKVSTDWAFNLRERERVIAEANNAIKTKYDKFSRELPSLKLGDQVRCQNARTKKWDRYGTIVEEKKHRQYIVKMEGSGRLSNRNRRHLQKVITHIPEVTHTLTKNNTQTTSTSFTIPSTADIESNVNHSIIPSREPMSDQHDINPSAIENHYVPLRRSRREKRGPRYYHDEYN